MKKLVILLVVLCLVLGGIFGASELRLAAAPSPAEEEVPYEMVIVPEEEEASPAEQPEEAPVAAPEESPVSAPEEEPTVASGRVNYEALYALHELGEWDLPWTKSN